MATNKEIVVTLRLEDRGAVERLGKLEIETKAYQRELRALNAEIAKNGEATRQQTQRVGELQASIRRNQTVVRELKNDLSGATDAGLRFRDKMAEASRAGLGAFGIQALSIASITTGLIAAVRELSNLSAEIEKVDARNAAIAGESLPALTRAAEDNANAIGLTRREYVSLAADQQLRLKNLGIEGTLTEELAIRTVEQAEALADFSGGTLDTAGAAKLLNDALTGQTRGLKELGINVKASKEEIAAIADEYVRTRGLTQEQAEAVATLELAFRATEETMAVFKDQTLAIDAAQDAANAKLKEGKEELAEGLAPAFTAAAQAGAGLLDVFAKIAQAQFGGPQGISSLIEDVGRTLNEEFQGSIDAFVKTATDAQIKAQQELIAERIRTLKLNGEGNAVAEAEIARLVDLYKQLQGGIEGTTVAIQGQGEATRPQVETIASLRVKLKELKDQREELNIADKEALDNNAAEIAAIEARIKAVDNETTSVTKLTAAQIEANRVAKEAAAGRAQPVPERLQAVETTVQTTPLSLTPEGVTKAEIAAQQYLKITEDIRILEIQGITDFNAQLLQLEAEKNSGKLKSEEEYQARKTAIQADAERAEFDNQQRMVAAAGDFFGALSSLAAEGSAEFKALATTQALINTYLGATQALSNPLVLNPFVKILQAAAIIANGLAAVNRIQGFAEGGRVKRNGRVTEDWGTPVNRSNGDTVLATLKPNEAVLNEYQQQRAKNLYGDDFFKRIGVPGFAGGGRTVYSFSKATGIAPRPSPGELIATERLAEQRAMEFAPVVSVVEINKVQNRTKVIENLASA